MGLERSKFGEKKTPSSRFWKNEKPKTPPPPSDESDEMEIENLVNDFKSISIQKKMSRAVLTDTNSNFKELCNQLNDMQVSSYRKKVLEEADLIAERVEHDLELINKHHGIAKNDVELTQRMLNVQIFQTYKRCLELDIEKWKYDLKLHGKSPKEIQSVKIIIPEFVPWEQRLHLAPSYAKEKLLKPISNSIVSQIGFVQLALNYWRSCYRNIRQYEKLLKLNPYEAEKELWKLEQTTMSYRYALVGGVPVDDLNRARLREPKNIDPTTGEPLSVDNMQKMIKKQQEKSGYKFSK